MQKHIRFDWAIKHLLRNKANFGILEGFLSELLEENIVIENILESESNKETEDDKFNRVDLFVKNAKGEYIIIEVQNTREYDYFHRILYGVSKAITEHIKEGEAYKSVKKIISLSIVYFDIGQGQDYIYKGTTTFRGLNNNDILGLSNEQKRLFSKEIIEDIFPTNYIIKVQKFQNTIYKSLDEWVYFLKNSEIRAEFSAKGIQEAKEKLDVLRMNESEQKQYNKFLENLRYEASINDTFRFDAEQNQLKRIASQMKKKGYPTTDIIEMTGLTEPEIDEL